MVRKDSPKPIRNEYASAYPRDFFVSSHVQEAQELPEEGGTELKVKPIMVIL